MCSPFGIFANQSLYEVSRLQRLLFPKCLQETVLEVVNNWPISGHLGVEKTKLNETLECPSRLEMN